MCQTTTSGQPFHSKNSTRLNSNLNTKKLVVARELIFITRLYIATSALDVHPGWGAAVGEADKTRRWKEAIKSRQDRVAHEVKVVPFCVEVGGAWGSAAKTFFSTCVDLAGDDRDIDLYHWSSERFSAARRTTISVLVAKGRARVGVAASAADWPKRIRDMQFLDHEGYATAT